MKPFLINAYLKSNPAMRKFLADHGTLSQIDLRALQVLDSPHVRTVEVELLGRAGHVRTYRAVTRDNNQNAAHVYTVVFTDKVDFETGEVLYRAGKCNCRAGSTPVFDFDDQEFVLCRHLIRAAQMDAERFNEEFYPAAVARYRGHLTRKQSVAAPAAVTAVAAVAAAPELAAVNPTPVKPVSRLLANLLDLNALPKRAAATAAHRIAQ